MHSARDVEKLGRGTGRVCLAIACLCCISSVRASLPTTADKPQPAAWLAYDLVLTLQHLPKRYSCDDLRYKVNDVLLAIGARPKSIFPYRCEAALGSRARSPQVHLQFSFPEVLNGQHGQPESGLSVVRRTIELRPGRPATLTDSDCVLLRQLKERLLPAIPVRVVSYRMSCEAPGRAKPPFQLSVSAWTGSNPSSRLAAVSPTSGTHPGDRQ
jgi:hypothetical protein